MGFEWLPGKNYKRHFICLECQKGFKRASEKDLKNKKSIDLFGLMDKYYSSDSTIDIIKFIEKEHGKLKVTCPNCRNEMIQVHYDFEIPSHRDNKSWKTLKKRYLNTGEINYNIYIQWHITKLKEVSSKSEASVALSENLNKLQRIKS